ncbi:MAG: TIGR02757 family protein [Thermodesulfovibrionales bacterium]
MSLKQILDGFYAGYDFGGRMNLDPIAFPKQYRDPLDIEAAAFIAASFAYGRIDLFRPVVDRILGMMGPHPAGFLLEYDCRAGLRLLNGLSYRFNRTEDIAAFLESLHQAYRTHGSLESLFASFDRSDEPTIESGLTALMAALAAADTSGVYGNRQKPAGLLQLFPSPQWGGACKRPNLFLRWMVRDRDIDFGIWKGVAKNRLVIPLDTHIARIARCLGLTKRKSDGWRTAVEITSALRRFDPDDPLKYDFALCHHGISGACSGRKGEGCGACAFLGEKAKGPGHKVSGCSRSR